MTDQHGPGDWRPVSQPGYGVVIPSTPDEPFLAQAIESALGQSLPPQRLIVCVNGPTAQQSHSAQVASEYAPIVETMFLPQKSESAALNRGIHAVDTEFVAFVDADDIWHPDKQHAQLDLLATDASLDAATGITENFRIRPDGTREILEAHESALVAATTFRLSTFDRYGLFDESAAHFQWLYRWWAAARRGGINTASINTACLFRRVHDNNSWSQNRDYGLSQLHAELRENMRAKRVDDSRQGQHD